MASPPTSPSSASRSPSSESSSRPPSASRRRAAGNDATDDASPPSDADALRALLDALDASTVDAALHRLDVMKRHLAQYVDERQRLNKLGLDDLDDAFDLMLAMKKRVQRARRENERILNAYREDRDAQQRRAQGLHDLFEEVYSEMRRIQHLLDVETNQGALHKIQRLQDRLDAYESAEENLREIQAAFDLDTSSEETLKALRSVNEQLETLYEEKQALSQAGLDNADQAVSMIKSMREQLDDMYSEKQSTERQATDAVEGDTFEQLQSLLAKQELLERELGVSDPEQVVEMVHNLEEQIVEELDGRDDSTPDDTVALSRDDVETLRRHTDDLADEKASLHARLDRLQELVGTQHPRAIADAMTALKKQVAVQHTTVDVALNADEVAPFVDDETLETLESMEAEALRALDVGVVTLDDDGIVRFAAPLESPRPDLPGLRRDDATGAHFFDDLVPSARGPLFEGRFREGVRQGAMDARFSYAFATHDQRFPLHLKIHLHRKPGESVSWILYAPVDAESPPPPEDAPSSGDEHVAPPSSEPA